ncbi:C40 family peptidase [Arthrobacter sp. JSM 101049]|uniref:C40 family peptidase n=1 Tax=Arthrobacter sp. JSM 101049 TaxID=929097 RepID=UPI00356354B0
MTKRQALGRHRATPVRTNPLESISKAVSSNAGSVGRQAAVIAAASGLVLTLGVPAQGATAVREADKAPAADLLRASVATPATVKVPEKKTSKSAPVTVSVADIESTDGSAYRAAQREAAAEREAAQEAAAEREAAQEAAAGAAMTRESRQASSSQGTTTVASAEKPKKIASAPSAGLSGIAATAMAYKGSPYVFGGATPGGWDCSGFVKYVYAQHGISLPHGTSALRSSGKFVRTSNPKPGDLVFQNGGSHVGIYIGGGQIIGAQNPSVGTVLRPANSPYGPLTGYYTYAG